MRLPIVLLAFLGPLLAQTESLPGDSSEWLKRGAGALRENNFGGAVEAFQHALDLDPNNVNANLYLATAYMQQYIPGADSPQNRAQAGRAEAAFQRVLEIDRKNTLALSSLATLKYQQAQPRTDFVEKSRLLNEAKDWYLKLEAADPAN